MIKSGRSKRRKTRQEINVLDKIYSNHKLNKCDSNTSKEKSPLLEENRTIITENNNFMVDNDIVFSSESLVVDSSAVIVTPVEISSLSCTDLSKNCSLPIPISDFLSEWAVKYNIFHNAVNGLLKGLKTH